MKPDWDRLMSEVNGQGGDTLVADVDCTDEENGGQDLCELMDIQGFPTIRYGDPDGELQDYEGARDYDSLAAFAKEHVKPACSPFKLELCSDAEKKTIGEYEAKIASGELAQLIEEKEGALKAAEEAFDQGVEALQAQYEALQDQKKMDQDAIKKSGLSLMKAVLKKSQAGETDGAKSEL